MVYRNPAAPASEPPTRRPSAFRFRTARARLGDDRFELSFWDYEPALFVAMAAPAGLLQAVVPLHLGWLIAPLCIAAVLARRALVVTPDSSWFEQRLLGVRWRRISLGRRPMVDSGFVWDWSEVSASPSDDAVKAASKMLREDGRVVLAEWTDDARDADAQRLAALARCEIARLHDRPRTGP